jgi:carbon starvation protein CstA
VSWRRVLLGLVVVGLACAPVSWIDEGVTPSWVVYPVALLFGLYRLRKGGATGTVFVGIAALVFLVVHLPFSYEAVFGDENPFDADREFSPVQWLITLFAIPLATVVAAWLARREARTGAASRSLP